MKLKTVILFFIVCFSFKNITAQVVEPGQNIDTNLDTVITTNARLLYSSTNWTTTDSNNQSYSLPPGYYVNRIKVSEEVYHHLDSLLNNLNKCTPCFLKVYDTDNNLVWESEHYKNCGVGPFVEYYPGGSIKITGQFKQNLSGNWDDISAKEYRSKREGKWTYYDTEGKITKVENYEDGKLIK
jgi:antitoxin component YwqK of YwqJK toxin-antitoxin module